MTPSLITDLQDPRIAGYRNMRERDLRAEGLFITEGALLAERLVASRFPAESFLMSVDSAATFDPALLGRTPVYIAPATLLREIAGFDFHRGVLGLGRRLPFPAVNTLVATDGESRELPGTLRLIACPATETAENLGMIFRSATAFGIDGALLPAKGADPLSRRCLRQSMGAALSLSIATSPDLLSELRLLKDTAAIRFVAAVAGDHPDVVPLSGFAPPSRTVLIVGNEYSGLDEPWLELCDYHVTIPLAAGCDSLNVAVATGIILHHMRPS